MAAVYPDYVARFYDVIYAQVRTTDHDYYLKKILAANGSVLEIGVGTGRFFLDALNSGADVFGIDASETMLQVLKQQLDPSHHFRISNQQAEEFSLERKFDLIIAPFRVFSHLVTIEQQLHALERIHLHLNENGIFIFDLFVPNLKLLAEGGMSEHVDFKGEYEPGKKLQRITSFQTDYMNQVNNVTMRYEWEENDDMNSHSWTFQMRYFFHWEIEHLIARSPLKLETIYGDYEENPLRNESNDFVVVCRK
ncbi:MAG: class I SAM-dependent methyltransferase [Chitinophagales bacterium]